MPSFWRDIKDIGYPFFSDIKEALINKKCPEFLLSAGKYANVQ